MYGAGACQNQTTTTCVIKITPAVPAGKPALRNLSGNEMIRRGAAIEINMTCCATRAVKSAEESGHKGDTKIMARAIQAAVQNR